MKDGRRGYREMQWEVAAGHRKQAKGYRRRRRSSSSSSSSTKPSNSLFILAMSLCFCTARALEAVRLPPQRIISLGGGGTIASSCGLFRKQQQQQRQQNKRRSPSSSSSSSSPLTVQRMVLTTPESIIEKASTEKLLDNLIDESTRTTPRRPIMMQFDPSSGWIWKRWTGTVFSETWDSCLGRMVYAAVILFICHYFPSIQRHLTGFNILWGQLLSVTTFTLTFFVNQSYALWRKCYELSRRMQGRLHDISLTLAAHATRKAPASPNEPSTYTAASRQQLELVSRYVRLFNILTYASFTRSHRPILTPRGMRRLVERGLLTAAEREVLVDAELPATQRHNAVLLWITRAFVEGWEAGHFQGNAGFESELMEKVHVLRASYGGIGDELSGRMPLAYAHIVQVLVDTILWLYPFMAISSNMSGLLTILGTGILTASYQGLFQLAKQFLDPYDNESFGKGEDPLVVDTLIAETNAGSVRWMNGLEYFPVSPQRIKDGELSDYLLPQRGYSVDELNIMKQERLLRERELQERREKEEEERRLVEKKAAALRRAAEAMTPAIIDTTALPYPVTKDTLFAMVDDRLSPFRVPKGILMSTSWSAGKSVAKVVRNMNALTGGIPTSLVPVGTAVAYEETPKSVSKARKEKAGQNMINGDKLGVKPEEEDEDDDLDWVDSDAGLEEDYVHSFSSFDLYKDLPWFEEVGPDGKEIRLSQMLADEVWEEEMEAAREKEEIMRTFAELKRKASEIEDDASQELAETRSILEAMPGAEIGTISIKIHKEAPKYDQTKLDGISQLWGSAPGELSDLQSYEEPPIAPGDDNFDGIAQLYGGGVSKPSSAVDDVDDLSTFSGINMLWGDLGRDDVFSDSELSSSATRPVRGGTRAMRYEDIDAWASAAGIAPVGNEVRLSQILADEVWVEERDYEPPDMPTESYKDIVKYAAEILEAEKEERLETEAILNAKPFAEFVRVAEGDKSIKALKANSTMDDDGLAVLEMDLPDNGPTKQFVEIMTTTATLVEEKPTKESVEIVSTATPPITTNVTTSQEDLGETPDESVTTTSTTVTTADLQMSDGGDDAEDRNDISSRKSIDSGVGVVEDEDASTLLDVDVTSDGGTINQEQQPASIIDQVQNESNATSHQEEEASDDAADDGHKSDNTSSSRQD